MIDMKMHEESGKKKGKKIEVSFIHSFNKSSLSMYSLNGPELGGGTRRPNSTVSVFKIIYCPGTSYGRQ